MIVYTQMLVQRFRVPRKSNLHVELHIDYLPLFDQVFGDFLRSLHPILKIIRLFLFFLNLFVLLYSHHIAVWHS